MPRLSAVQGFSRRPLGPVLGLAAVCPHGAQGLGAQGLRLALGLPVAPGDAGQQLPHSLVIGGVLVAGGPVDRPQGGAVEFHGGHRLAWHGQLGQVSGHQLRRRRQGVAAATGPRPGLEAPPGGGVHDPGVVGHGAVQEVGDPLSVGAGDGPVTGRNGLQSHGISRKVSAL